MMKRKMFLDLVYEALPKTVDPLLREHGFCRNRRGLIYNRKIENGEQQIRLYLASNPSYASVSGVELLSTIFVVLPSVNALARHLASGYQDLIHQPAGITFAQPSDIAAPIERRRTFFATPKQISSVLSAYASWCDEWVIPLLDRMRSAQDLIDIYANEKGKLMLVPGNRFSIAAAFAGESRLDEAWNTILEGFNQNLLNRKYPKVVKRFEDLKRSRKKK
jgi:hypothetical protein